VLTDWVAIEGRRIVEVGKRPDEIPRAFPTGRPVKIVRAFDPEAFDSVAAAMLRSAAFRGARLGRSGWRASFAPSETVQLSWPDWTRLTWSDRRRFATSLGRLRREVNHRVIAHHAIDLPIVRSLVGTRVVPDPVMG